MRALVLVSSLLLLGAAPVWAQAVPSKCNAAKSKATGAYLQAVLACKAKSFQKGEPVAEDCFPNALAKLEKAFERAQKKGDCAGSGSAVTAQGNADAGLLGVVAALFPEVVCCDLGNLCGWRNDAADCALAGGTVGAEGSSCDGAGACVAGPPAAGPCCTNAGDCNGGPVGVAECTGAGGTFVEQGLCLAPGECLAQ
jgi:hypothetical protein